MASTNYSIDNESVAETPSSSAMASFSENPQMPLVRSLIQPDYDSKMVKHQWVNAVLGSSSSQDFSEQLLRLYRMELRGSHLYVYRPPLQMNVRMFRLELSDMFKHMDIDSIALDTTTYAPTEGATSTLRGASDLTSVPSTPMLGDQSSNATVGRSFTSNPLVPPEIATDSNTSDSPVVLKYWQQTLPHPDLKYDFETDVFLVGSSLEALVHFFIFADESQHSRAIEQLSSIFPMIPNFYEALEIMHKMLAAIFQGKFGEVETIHISERVIHLLEHLDRNFCGYLLNSDVGQHILQILELFSDVATSETIELVSLFKTNMLGKQRKLLNLINPVDSSARSSPSESPFLELNSTTFMKDISLLDLASAIIAIDLDFFANWNSSIDKSLLLYSSISGNTPGNQFYKKNSLFFNNENHIHYLSRLLIHHLFLENPHATPEKRARILERWIDLGCLLDKLGNMSSWLGISSIILSQPVLRLTTVWTHVSADYVKLLRNDWSPVLFELDRRHLANSYELINYGTSSVVGTELEMNAASKDTYHIMAPRGLGKIYPKDSVIPYFGDLLISNVGPTNIPELDAIWRKINYSFDRWNDYLKNLFNANEIIKYNQDVLRRYDSMSFIFSNESLNQVLYLGVNKDDEKIIPSTLKETLHDADLSRGHEEKVEVKLNLKKKLLRLLDHNCESINLEDIMKLSLQLEPSLRESYLNLPQTDISLHKVLAHNGSSLSINSISSSVNGGGENVDNNLSGNRDPSTQDKLPTFNNHYFLINLQKYDHLVGSPELSNSVLTNDKQDIVVDNDLALKLDDFVSDCDIASTINTSIMETSGAGDDGLGFDVDDILNSDKFKSFSIENEEDGESSGLVKKHRSFGLISNNSNLAQHALSLKYVPRFASIDKLIDLLLIDSKYFDEDHLIDLTEYRFVFLLNYNSFMSTTQLLEKLAHRFVHSGNAVISVMKYQYLKKQGKYDPVIFGNYPSWEADREFDLSKLGNGDYDLLLNIQVNILKALVVLVNNFYSNFSNDLKNKKIMIKLLKLYSNEILQWYNSNKIDHELDNSFENLVNYYKRLKKLFVKKSYRPVEVLKFEKFLTEEFKFSNSIHEVPMNRNLPSHKNIHKIEKFLNKFNKLLTVFYKGITPENWFKIFKILENLFENHSLVNYNIQKANVPEEYVVISDVMTYFESLYDLNSKDTVLRKLPVVFNKLFKLYYKFRSYLLIQLCDINIATEERLDRMKTLLLMTKISKLKMSESQFVFDGDHNDIPSCIETAITNVIYSPESRMFGSLWVDAAASLSPDDHDMTKSYDNIESLLPSLIKHSDLLMGSEPLLPCFGWIIQNLIEINRSPSFYNSTINFNKRYLIFKLIKELSVEDVDENEEFHNDTKEFEFLMRLDERLCSFSELKDHVQPGRLTKKLFRTVIKEQYAILTMEASKKAYRNSRRAVESGATREGGLSKKTSNSTLRRQSLTYKTNSSSRFKISGLFSKSRTFSLGTNSERVVDFRELPEPKSVAEPKMKPVIIIPLKDRKIFPVYLLPNCFKVDHESSNEVCFFQSPTDGEMKDWLRLLAYANRHWFYSKAISSRHNRDFTTFGIPLHIVCARDNRNSPLILESIYKAIEEEGLKEVGIYRISTSISELSNIKSEIDKTGSIHFEKRGIDVHALTSCIKLYFRELPEAILTDQVIELFYPMRQESSKGQNGIAQDNAIDVERFRSVLSMLPKYNYSTLKSLIMHLNAVVQENEYNRMNASNLATVIGPALTEASNLDSLINNFGVINYILEQLIDNYEIIFEGMQLEGAPALPSDDEGDAL